MRPLNVGLLGFGTVGKGVFDVLADGKKIFSKHEVGRFPALGEVADAIEEALDG